MKNKPNIIVFFTDQQRWDTSGLHGNPLSLMENFEKNLEEKYLNNFNNLLINIIEKIQNQNKKNHIFINKAIHSLSEIKGSIEGKKNYETYTKKGVTTYKVNNVVKKSSDDLGRNLVKPS